jgi:hypothetical protein
MGDAQPGLRVTTGNGSQITPQAIEIAENGLANRGPDRAAIKSID